MKGVHGRLAIGCGLLASCGGTPPPPPAPPVAQGPDDAILTIASRWEARHVDKGLRSKPSPIASFERTIVQRLELRKGAEESVLSSLYDERFALRDGTEVRCGTQIGIPLQVSYGRRQGEAALELGWGPLELQRACDPPDSRIPPLTEPAGRSRFVLRSDQLVGVEPPLEKRSFLPVE